MKRFSEISKTLKEYREEIGISQVDLAKTMKILNGQFISNIEKGKCSFPVRKLHLIRPEWRDSFINAMVSDYRSNLIHSIAPDEEGFVVCK